MTREYLRLLAKRRVQWLFLVSLLVIQGTECLNVPYGENAAEAFMSIRNINKFGLLFTPLFCLWNTPVYQVCSETKLTVRMGSPFGYIACYARLSVVSSLLYVVLCNCIAVPRALIFAGNTLGGEKLLLLLFFQLLFYMNCSLIFYLVSVISGGKTYLGFFVVVTYGMLDYVGSVFFSNLPWFFISTSYIVCSPEVIQSPPLLLRNFSVLTGTFLCLILIGFFVTDKWDFMEWGKTDD